MERNTDEIMKFIANTADDKKAIDIKVLNLSGISILADYFIICSGKTNTQVKAIARSIIDDLEEEFEIEVRRKEGLDQSRWVLLDYADIIVHIFHQEEREFYELERLWGDAENVDWVE
jgi:ribosome-associated protein